MLIYIAIFVFFCRAYYEGYKNLSQSDVKDSDVVFKLDTDEDSVDDDTDSLYKAVDINALKIRMKAKNEIKEFGR